MLSHIVIRDLAIVDRVELTLDGGMTALTGETGAGKSILIDALGFVLGDRADSESVRHGCKRAEISASFDLHDNPAAQNWLFENELDSDDDCLVRRIISTEGRSRGFINGSPVTMQAMREFGETLVDIHGQHEHQSLMRPGMQGTLLDSYAAHDKLCKAVAQAWRAWHDAKQEYDHLLTAASDRAARLDFLRYQVNELEALAPQGNEYHELDQEHGRLANLSRLQETTQSVITTLDGDELNNVNSMLGRASHSLRELATVDESIAEQAGSLDEALANIDDVVKSLRHYQDSLDAEPGRLETVEARLGALLDTARKHHCEPDELPDLLEQLQQELDALDNADSHLEALQARIDTLAADYEKAASKLTASRKKAATRLADTISKHMQELGMPGGEFDIALHARQTGAWHEHGMERIEFLVSANPGQPAKPLTKVASGGELSRISLAIQVAAAHTTGIPVLVFDEVDVGIGGGVAEIVGRELHALAENRQVLCVTHLPQVAAQANHHLNVNKQVESGQTRTTLRLLDDEARTEEIARMLGGVKITEQTLAHAREMLGMAKKSA
ncbi:MAG: DNA repair protein RecN [Granulosicoccaceae bacterium]|jgi:DNA repair protein RecN (Recombination protein N)